MANRSVAFAKGALGAVLSGTLCLGISVGSSGATGSSSVQWNPTPAGYVAAGGTRLPGSYPTPTKSPGQGCKIGYISPSNVIPGIQTEIDGVSTLAQQFGCTVVSEDGQGNPQVQVTGMESLLSEGVSAIILNPLVIGALAAPIQQANAKHVPVIVEDSPASPTAPDVSGTASDYLQSRDATAYAAAEAIAKAHPRAHVGLLYPAFPAGNLQYQVQRFQYWAHKLGLHVVGMAGSSADSPTADSQAANSLLEKHRSIQAIMTFNDTAAESTASAARALGLKNILVTGINGEQGVLGLIRQGRVLMTWAYNNTTNGENLGKAAIDAANGIQIPVKVGAPGAIIDRANVSSYKPQA